jgi:hypothetical protein
MWGRSCFVDAQAALEGGERMRAKINWRHLLVTGATMAALLLAAGARWKPY